MYQLIVGEIGRDRKECMYDMSHCDIVLIIRGYRRRNILQYQLQRMNIWASMFCMGNPENKLPHDVVHLYFDDYKGQNDPPLTEEERAELKQEMEMLKGMKW